jgi:hypothetical protein
MHLERDVLERHGPVKAARHVPHVDHSSSIRSL